MTIETGNVIDNRTICDLFGVGSMGGIRVNTERNTIVLISNNTVLAYRNEWIDGVLHFVGRGTTGPQKLDRQNKTLAAAPKSGTTLHLFESFEKSLYVYAGEVELADAPYISDQYDDLSESRLVWKFPLRRKLKTHSAHDDASSDLKKAKLKFLPAGAYAVIGRPSANQRDAVDKVLDQLRQIGVSVFDQRDVDRNRYDRALARWYHRVLDRVRSTVNDLIETRKHLAKRSNRSFVLEDDMRVNAASTEHDLREALKLLDHDHPVSMEAVFEDARRSIPMPEPPVWLSQEPSDDPAGETWKFDSRSGSKRFEGFS
jgi:hypothetical protein